jgi:hypothetical protein
MGAGAADDDALSRWLSQGGLATLDGIRHARQGVHARHRERAGASLGSRRDRPSLSREARRSTRSYAVERGRAGTSTTTCSARARTSSATEPSTMRERPVRPCVPRQIASTCSRVAARQIPKLGTSSSTTSSSVRTPRCCDFGGMSWLSRARGLKSFERNGRGQAEARMLAHGPYDPSDNQVRVRIRASSPQSSPESSTTCTRIMGHPMRFARAAATSDAC